MKKLPIGIQSIKKILGKRDYVYVDKTLFAKQLIEDEAPHYFISRPRRFGKSLFLNTLKEIFLGNKELFKGSQIDKSGYDFEQHPVIALDFSRIASRTAAEFEIALQEAVTKSAKSHGIAVEGSSMEIRLEMLIEELGKERGVVVLVDEYDSPIINHLNELEIAHRNHHLIKSFFGTLKSLDEYLRFTFVTGVSKFSQLSLFSGPNNLTDITMDPLFAGIMGYTEEEIQGYFSNHIETMALAGRDKRAIQEELKRWYNGYRFSTQKLSVYNPYSTLRFLKGQKAESYWYSTGTPSFLINEVKKHPQSVVPLRGTVASKPQLADISSLEEIDLTALMFQTGYLTISSYNEQTELYQLDFPNQEVKAAFLNSLIHHFTNLTPSFAMQCQEMAEERALTPLFDRIKILFASFPYQLFAKANEATYHGILLGMFKGMGLAAEGEKTTLLGRIDLLVEMETKIYIFEIKLDGSAEDALQQIYDRNYFGAYMNQGKEIILLGVNFSSKSRNISDWQGAYLTPLGERIKL